MKIWAKKNLINQHQGRQGPQEHHMTDDRFSYTKGMSTTKRRFNSNVHTSKQTKSLDVALLICTIHFHHSRKGFLVFNLQ